MSKSKTTYNCKECGALSYQWSGQCTDCSAWNSFEEVLATQPKAGSRFKGYAAVDEAKIISLNAVPMTSNLSIPTGQTELDRVLGGGLVAGSVVLIGGDPGIGKSTLLLQTLSHLSTELKTLYVTGEESLQQVKLRASRLGFENAPLNLLSETQVERLLSLAANEKPQVMVVDSIQTMYTELLQSAAGSVSQVRESAQQLVNFAKQSHTALFLVGHVTKEGAIAGPRVLEHMVDTVLYFEGEADSRYRVIRAVKNRFGAVNELGIFAMTEKGLRGVNNPSAIFLSRGSEPSSGSIVTVTWEGSRPMLIEVQALVDESHLANPRRVTVGLEANRLAMSLAVLHRHAGVITYNQDVFVNIVGGMRIQETALDLPVLLSVISSLKNRPLPQDLIAIGEVGLNGEIRPIQNGEARLKEAAKHGFKRAIAPMGNTPKKSIEGMEITSVQRLSQALAAFSN